MKELKELKKQIVISSNDVYMKNRNKAYNRFVIILINFDMI